VSPGESSFEHLFHLPVSKVKIVRRTKLLTYEYHAVDFISDDIVSGVLVQDYAGKVPLNDIGTWHNEAGCKLHHPG